MPATAMSMSCMGYGFQVKILINGTDIGAKGGQSESKLLFPTDDARKNDAPPEMRERLFVLKTGENTIHLEFTKTGKETDRLTYEMYVEGKDEPLLKFETADTSGLFEKTFNL